jgi:nucleoside-diphosphate-sugar epimerase
MSFAAERGVPVTVLRPCAIYGPGDTRLLKLFRMAARGWFPMLGGGKGLYHLIHVHDLVEATIVAAVHPSAVGEAFIVGNPEAMTLEAIARTVGRTLGRQVRVVRLPAWPFFAAAAVCEVVCRPFGVEPPLYRRRVAFYTKDRAFDTRKLREVLGYNVRYANEEGISQTAQWYRGQGWL